MQHSHNHHVNIPCTYVQHSTRPSVRLTDCYRTYLHKPEKVIVFEIALLCPLLRLRSFLGHLCFRFQTSFNDERSLSTCVCLVPYVSDLIVLFSGVPVLQIYVYLNCSEPSAFEVGLLGVGVYW